MLLHYGYLHATSDEQMLHKQLVTSDDLHSITPCTVASFAKTTPSSTSAFPRQPTTCVTCHHTLAKSGKKVTVKLN